MNHRTLAFSLFAALGLWTLQDRAPRPGDLASTTAVVAASLQGDQPATLQSLRGPHGFSYSGSVGGTSDVASSGLIHFDGRGNLSATYSTSVGGTTFQGSFVGTYTVHPDGTGAVVLDLPRLGLQAHGDFVLVDNGRGTFFMSTDQGFSVAGSTRRS